MFFLTGDLCEPKLGASSPAASNTLNKGNAASPVKKHIDANKWLVTFSTTVQFTYVNTI